MKKSVLLKRGGILGLVIMGVCVVLALSMLINTAIVAKRDKNNPLLEAFVLEETSNGKAYVLTSCDLCHVEGKNQDTVTRYELPSRYDGKPVAIVGERAFYNNKEIEVLVVPRTYKRLRSCSFLHCSNLKTVEFSAFSNLEHIGAGAFANSGLETFTMPNSVDLMGQCTFYECEQLIYVKLSRRLKTLRFATFSGCSSLETVEFGAFSKLEVIETMAFMETKSLKSIEFPSSLEAIGDSAFRGSGLTSITIPKGVERMGEGVFYGCENLTDIYCEAKSMPEGWSPEWLEGCNATVHWGA